MRVGADYLPQSEPQKEMAVTSFITPALPDERPEPKPEPKPEPRRDGMIRTEIKHQKTRPSSHLSDLLKPREDREKNKPNRVAIDIEALRKAITDSLRKDVSHEETPPTQAPGPKQDGY